MLVLGQFLLEWKLFRRDRTALFWSFAFPVLLLVGMGVVFRPGTGARGLHYLLPGLLGMNLVSMGLFNVGLVLVKDRESGKLRRLAVTPLPKWVFLLGKILHRLSLSFLQSTALLVIGNGLFGIRNQGSYLLLATVLALGAGCFMAIGFALSGFAKSTEGYSAFANAAFFPLLFLSGVYFPMDTAPRWAQQIPSLLPLSPCLQILRAVFNGAAGLVHLGAALAVVVAWTGVCSGLALMRFRWA